MKIKRKEMTLIGFMQEKLVSHKKLTMDKEHLPMQGFGFYVRERGWFGNEVCNVEPDAIYHLDEKSPYYDEIIGMVREFESLTLTEVAVSLDTY